MHPHNELLNQGSELGIPGIIFFILFFLIIYGKALQALYTLPQKEALIILIALSGLTISLVEWQFDTNFLFPISRFLTGLYLSILFQKIKFTEPSFSISKKAFDGISRITVAACFLIVSLYFFNLFLSEKNLYTINPQPKKKLSQIISFTSFGQFQPLIALAVQYVTREDWIHANPVIEKLSYYYPNVPRVLVLAAQLKIHKKKQEEAILLLKKALQIDPTYSKAKSLLEVLEQTFPKSP